MRLRLPPFHGRFARLTLISADGGRWHTSSCGEGESPFVLFLLRFLLRASFAQSGGWLWCVTACLVLKLLALFIYMEMDHKQGSELTCLNTTYLRHHPCKYRDPISATNPTNFHVSVVPAVNVILFSDNRACVPK